MNESFSEKRIKAYKKTKEGIVEWKVLNLFTNFALL
jgi:hypothetical protein